MSYTATPQDSIAPPSIEQQEAWVDADGTNVMRIRISNTYMT
jgi:hypothetical protein